MDHPPVNGDEEFRELKLQLRQAEETGRVVLIPYFCTRLGDLEYAIMRERPHVLHFCCHGHESHIILENEHRNGSLLPLKHLGALLHALKSPVRLVVLNACITSPDGVRAANLAEYVVSFVGPVEEGLAVKFTSSFYNAAAFDHSIRESFEIARAAFNAWSHEAKPATRKGNESHQERAVAPLLICRPGSRSGDRRLFAPREPGRIGMERKADDAISRVFRFLSS